MPFANETLLENINKFGIDAIVERTDVSDIEDDTIKIIFRTIKDSKQILRETLEEFVNDKKKIIPDAKKSG